MQKYLENKIAEFIKNRALITKGEKTLVAFSGGPDSLFLLHVLYKLKKRLKFDLTAMHLNHNLRGGESLEDEKFCAEFCSEMGIDFYSQSVNVKEFAASESLSIEEAARILRYRALNETAKKIGADKIATAHNMDDNAETVLLNLIKGKGFKAAAGIPVMREKIVRPLLSIKKSEILEYLSKENIPYRIDSSNKNDIYQRNFIRNRVMPLIKENLNPKVEEALFRYSEILSAHAEAFDEIISKLFDTYIRLSEETAEINLQILSDYGNNTTLEVLKRLFIEKFDKELHYSDKRHLFSLFDNQVGKRLLLSDGLEVIRERDCLIVRTAKENEDFEISVSIGETVNTPLGKLSVEETDEDISLQEQNRKIEYAEADNIKNKFVLRKWKNGDKFFPLGMKSQKKVSDYLTDEKVPTQSRRDQLVLLNDGKIVWLVGHRLDERYKITKKTKRVIKLWLN